LFSSTTKQESYSASKANADRLALSFWQSRTSALIPMPRLNSTLRLERRNKGSILQKTNGWPAIIIPAFAALFLPITTWIPGRFTRFPGRKSFGNSATDDAPRGRLTDASMMLSGRRFHRCRGARRRTKGLTRTFLAVPQAPDYPGATFCGSPICQTSYSTGSKRRFGARPANPVCARCLGSPRSSRNSASVATAKISDSLRQTSMA
jgi:hypothetical protein